jgi:hypothetical protein
MFMVSLDSSGDTLWTRKYGKTIGDIGNDLIQIGDNSFILAGSRVSSTSVSPRSYLQMISPEGNLIWENYSGNGSTTENIQKVLITDNNTILATGTNLGSTRSAIFLRMYKLNGELLYSKELENDSQELNIFRDCSISKQGKLVVAAFTSFIAGGEIMVFEMDCFSGKTKICSSNPVFSKSSILKPSCYTLLGQQLNTGLTQHLPAYSIPVHKTHQWLSPAKAEINLH